MVLKALKIANTSTSSSLNLVVNYFLLCGGAFFIYYSLMHGKFVYLLGSIIIYIVSIILRVFVLKSPLPKGFTEPGMFFLCFTFLAYVLVVFKLDMEIVDYLPDKLLLQSGAAFVMIVAISTFTSVGRAHNDGSDKFKYAFSLMLVFLTLGVFLFEDFLNATLRDAEWLTQAVIGFPIIYLGLLLTGLTNIKRLPEN